MEASQINVVVVDDQQITRVGLATVLNEFSDICIVAQSEGGEAAIQTLATNPARVLLLDISQSSDRGFETLQMIKEIAPQTKIIILSTPVDQDSFLKSLAAGADGYCSSHSSGSQIASAIRTVNAELLCLDSSMAKSVFSQTITHPHGSEPNDNTAIEKNRFGLSPRELEVLTHVVDGQTNHQIAANLSLSVDTVKNHMRYVLAKLSVSDRTQAAVKAMKEGLV